MMEIVRTALIGPAATTLFSEFLMRDQSAIVQGSERQTCETLLEQDPQGDAHVDAAVEGDERTLLAPCQVDVHDR